MSQTNYSSEQKLIAKRINALGSRNNELGKAQYPYYTRQLLLSFAKFIDAPHCYNNQLHDLLYCQSTVIGLQLRQRITCVKVMTVLCAKMDVENYQVGIAKSDYMDTITHDAIMRLYEQFWGESISLKRYYHTIHLLKMADFLTVDAVYIFDEEKPFPEDKQGNVREEDIPRVYSKAAYKAITAKFVRIFSHLDENESVCKSKRQAIEKRMRLGLSNVWVVYSAFSYSYVWVRRQLAKIIRRDSVTGKLQERYPQGREILPDIYGGNYLSEH